MEIFDGAIISGFFYFLFQLIAALWQLSITEFWIILATGIFLAGSTWWLARYIAFNVNCQPSTHTQHRIYCRITAIITLICTLLFFSVNFTENLAEATISTWQDEVRQDRLWRQETFSKAYEAVYVLKDATGEQLEDFTDKPHPKTREGVSTIPTTHTLSQQTAVAIYADEAVKNFKAQFPLLSLILWPGSTEAERSVMRDMELVFATGTANYSAEKAIDLVSTEIQDTLKIQVPRVVTVARIALILFFLCIQAILFGLLIRAALADIKVQQISSQLEN